MFNLFTKFDAFAIITCYKDMKGNAKCRNCSGLGWLKVTQGHQQCRHSIEHMRLPNRLCVYLLSFSGYSELFVEKRQF